MTLSEPNPSIRPTGEEAGEFLDVPPRAPDRSEVDDPTRRLTGSPPLSPAAGEDDATTDGYVMLERDHHEIEQEFTTFEQDDDTVVRELCEHLTAHIRREDSVLVPALRSVDGGNALAERVTGENSALTTMIAELHGSATPERIPELISALRGAVSAHLEAVESAIVPVLRAGGIDAQQLADELKAATTP